MCFLKRKILIKRIIKHIYWWAIVPAATCFYFPCFMGVRRKQEAKMIAFKYNFLKL